MFQAWMHCGRGFDVRCGISRKFHHSRHSSADGLPNCNPTNWWVSLCRGVKHAVGLLSWQSDLPEDCNELLQTASKSNTHTHTFHLKSSVYIYIYYISTVYCLCRIYICTNRLWIKTHRWQWSYLCRKHKPCRLPATVSAFCHGNTAENGAAGKAQRIK